MNFELPLRNAVARPSTANPADRGPVDPSRRRMGIGRDAFSLLELLAVVTILGIVATVVIPRIGASTNRAKAESCSQYKAEINAAAERYYFNEGKLAASLDVLQGDPDYFVDPIPACPVTKQAYTLDGVTGRVAGHVH